MKFKYIYGPVSSWRLGKSLGVDLISRKGKVCSFDCGYCQVGETHSLSVKREIFVPTHEILNEIGLLGKDVKIDYITFSGTGEPTLASNLGEVVREIKKIRPEKMALLTNSTLLYRDDVINDIREIDFVMAKLDAFDQESLGAINKPEAGISFDSIVASLKKFREFYKGKLALQIMFLEGNKNKVEEIAKIARDIGPDEVQINTPLRPSDEGYLSAEEISRIREYFKDIPVKSVYDKDRSKVQPIDLDKTEFRRGKVL